MGHRYASSTPLLQGRPRAEVKRSAPKARLRRNPGHSFATAEEVGVAPDTDAWVWPAAIGGVVVLGLLFWWGVRSIPAPVVK
jgi:hypothetical protein